MSSWVPPNDGELLTRSKMQAGWSTLSGHLVPLGARQTAPTPSLSRAETKEIRRVIKRARKAKRVDNNRVRKLYERYLSINKSQGNGTSTCVFCDCNFARVRVTPRVCSDCMKNCCITCSYDVPATEAPGTVVLCRMCFEYRDFWKKSGAWFVQRLPICGEHGLESGSDSSSASEESPDEQTQISHLSDKPDEPDHAEQEEEEAADETQAPAEAAAAPVVDDIDYTFCKMRSMLASNVSLADPARSATAAESTSSATPHDPHLQALANAISVSPIAPSDSNNNLDATGYHHSLLNGPSAAGDNHTTLVSSGRASAPSERSVDRLSVRPDSLLADAGTQELLEQIAASRRPTRASVQLSTSSIVATVDESRKKSLLGAADEAQLDAAGTASFTPGSLGYLRFNVEYVEWQQQLKINLVSAASLVAKDSNGLSDPYVKLHLLPGFARATKLRSKTVYKNLNPQFNELLHYDGITNDDLEAKTLRLTVLDEDKFGYDYIGEYRLPLRTLIRNEINEYYVPLAPHEEVADEETNASYRGKINFALKYKKSKNCLCVKIIRCTQLLPMDDGKSSDPYVQVAILPACKEIKHHKQKTSVKRKTLEPEFDHEFKFAKIDLNTLLSKTIEISVWDKDLGKSDFIGVVQLGQQRRDDELKHFYKMIKNPDVWHEQWHTLHMCDQIDEE